MSFLRLDRHLSKSRLVKKRAFCRLDRIIDSSVYSGPFTGMSYVSQSIGSAHYPKLLGTYEMELHEWIEKLCRIPFRQIINVGAGEGYYSVGFAFRISGVEVIAFEEVSEGRKLIDELAALNGVEQRVTVKGKCLLEDLTDALDQTEQTLIVMDCEGDEALLLREDSQPLLSRCIILLEVHEFEDPDLGNQIRACFKKSHKISEIWSRKRRLSDLPLQTSFIDRTLFREGLLDAMFENRSGPMRFFLMEPLKDKRS